MTQFNQSIPAFLATFAENQAVKQVLPLWTTHALRQPEGVMGAMSADGLSVVDSDKGAVMNARALWSFAFAYRQTGDAELLTTATHLYKGFTQHFIDPKFGGVFWSLDANNKGCGNSKPILAQTYAIYALAQYYLASNNSSAIELAHTLAALISNHYQRPDGTYASECALDFSPNSPEFDIYTDTCHQLHVLEALTQLYVALPSESVKHQLTDIVDMFLQHIFPAGDHLALLFTEDWKIAHQARSYGHNFEAPWLLAVACQAIGDHGRLALVDTQLLRLIDATLDDGRHSSGGFLYGISADGKPFNTLTWWAQAEAGNAFMRAFESSHDQRYLNLLIETWQHIKSHWIDAENGEWFTDLDLKLQPTGNLNKGDLWRCAYHTVRACFALSRGHRVLYNRNQNQKKTDALAATALSPSLVGFN